MKKAAVVTSGSQRIGYAVARQLGLDGYQIVILAIGGRTMYQEALNQLAKCEIAWHYIQGSIVLAEDRERLVKESVGHFDRIDILVNNAGVTLREERDFLEMTGGNFDRVIGIDTKGTMFLTRLVVKQMISQEQVFGNRGHIVNMDSCSAKVPSITKGEYCISKAAVCMLTTLFTDRLAPEGVVVNGVRPGVVATDMTSAVADRYSRMVANGGMPIARWGKSEDVAQMVSLSCSNKVLYIMDNYIGMGGSFHIKRL